MKLLPLLVLFAAAAQAQVAGHAPVRHPDQELRQGHAILAPRFNKDEAAFKALPAPSPDAIKAEREMQQCFAVARGTEGMYGIPDGQGMKPNCDRQFNALEAIIGK